MSLIFFRASEVDSFMSNVDVSAEDDIRVLFLQFLDKLQEMLVEGEFVLEALRRAAAVREVDVDKRKVFILSHDNAPFLIHIGNAEVESDLHGLNFAIDSDAGITLFESREVKVRMIALRRTSFFGQLLRQRFAFLNAENVWFFFENTIKRAFLVHRSQSVDVPRDYLHVINMVA